jgi:hypothetical protein
VNVLGMQTILEVNNLELFKADRTGPDGFVAVSRSTKAAVAEKTKALKG